MQIPLGRYKSAFLTRPLEGAWPYLWLDATCAKVREGGRIISRAVTIAVAVNEDGKREVPGAATGPSEAGNLLDRVPAQPGGPRPAGREAGDRR